jgi:hypothetical protein
VVFPNGRGLVMNGVALHVCYPESMFNLNNAMLSGQEGVLPLVQSSPPYHKLLPQLHDNRWFGHNIGGSPKLNNGGN